MSTRRILATGLMVFLLAFCLAGTAFATQGEGAQPCPASLLNCPFLDEKVAGLELPQLNLSAIKDLKDGQKVPSGDIQNIGSLMTLLGQAVSAQEKAAAAVKSDCPVLGVDTGTMSSEEQQMFGLVNQERASNGAGSLSSDPALVKLARLKAQDMVDNRYFNHNSPTYGSPFDMMKKFGISYSYAGENLAMAGSVSSAHKGLMESPGHRANILNKNYDRVGIGIVVSGGYRYCVQMFTGGQKGTIPDNSGQQPSPSPTPTQPPVQPGDSSGLSAEEQTLVNLINQERVKAGLPKLKADSKLFQLARLKARDFIENNYFGHTSPTYGPYRDMLRCYGVSFVKAGENLAATYTAARAHTALMNSPGNRANILSPDYKLVGIGIVNKGSYKYFVEMFTDGGSVSQPPSGGTTQPPSGGTTQPPSGGTTQPGTGNTAGLSADEQMMLNMVNSERAKNGLAPLRANLKLTEVARLKAKDMIAKNYFSHTSPTYGSPFDMMRQFGITYRTAGENLAGAPSVNSAHTNLMNSPGHRANILNSSFKEVGIGVVDGGPYGKMFVQMFIG